jgi:hypothetical protein
MAVPARVEGLAARARDHLVFLCGSVENEQEIWRFFDQVVYLAVEDEGTLRDRIATRTSNDFGRNELELAAILKWHKGGADRYHG